MQKKQKASTKVIDTVIVLGNIGGIYLVLRMIMGAVRSWFETYQYIVSVDAKLLWIGLIFAVLWCSADLFAMFIRNIGKSIRAMSK